MQWQLTEGILRNCGIMGVHVIAGHGPATGVVLWSQFEPSLYPHGSSRFFAAIIGPSLPVGSFKVGGWSPLYLLGTD